MKKVTVLSMLVIACFLIAKVFAQDVNSPKADQQAQVKTIFSFKDELSLTDDQVLKLKALLYDEQSAVDSSNAKLKALGADLGKAIDAKADMGSIRSKFEDISKIQIDLSCMNIEDGRKIETILSADQLSKWRDIQKKFSAQAKS